MKIPQSIQTSGWFKFVFSKDGFPAFVFAETFRDIVYVFLKVENLLLRRRVLRLERRIRSLQANHFVSVSHPIEQAIGDQGSDDRGNNRGGVDSRVNRHGCLENAVTRVAVDILANVSRHRGRKIGFPLQKPRKPSFGARHGYVVLRLGSLSAAKRARCSFRRLQTLIIRSSRSSS